jgi:hypothetical protein
MPYKKMTRPDSGGDASQTEDVAMTDIRGWAVAQADDDDDDDDDDEEDEELEADDE